MKNIIWLSPSLAAGAIAARLVAFFKKRPQNERPSGRGTYGTGSATAFAERVVK
jgi:hypothetical protein